MSKIEINNIYKIFGNKPQSILQMVKDGATKDEVLENTGHTVGLDNVSLKIEEGETFVCMGLSGSGKSTLIRHLNRLIEPTSGEILVEGTNVMSLNKQELIEFRRRKMSMVFQRFGLFPHKTVIQNVAYGLEMRNISQDERDKISMEKIEAVGLNGFENQYPNQLSGGMQQRVGLARAMATDAGILLMDEAFSSLDPLIRSSMQEILLDLQKELNKTIIFITHDLNEALRIGDQISILRDGEIIQTGSPEDILLGPKDKYISNFIKDINRGRMLKVSSIMRKNTSIKAPKILDNISIEDAIPILASASEGLAAVVNKNGNIIGKVSLDSAISALSSKK